MPTPLRWLCFKADPLPVQRMVEGDFPSVETEWRIGQGDGGGLAGLAIGKVERIPADGPAEVLQMDPDLIGPAGFGPGFEQGGAVRETLEHAEVRDCRKTGRVRSGLRFDDAAGAEGSGGCTDGGLTCEGILSGMPMDAYEIVFFHFAALELGLQDGGEVTGPADDHDSCGIGIEPVGGPGFLGVPGGGKETDEGVPVEAASSVHGQRCRLVENDDGFVLVEQENVRIDIGLDGGGDELDEALAAAHAVIRTHGLVALIPHTAAGEDGFP